MPETLDPYGCISSIVIFTSLALYKISSISNLNNVVMSKLELTKLLLISFCLIFSENILGKIYKLKIFI